MRLLCSIILLFSTTTFLSAQAPDSLHNWMQYSEQIFSIRYPTTNWLTTKELSTRFCLATKATESKPYDRDLIKVFVMDNEDGLHGDLDSFTNQYVRELKFDKQIQLVSSERVKNGALEYHEIKAKSIVGKIKRQWKERYYFVNGKIIHTVFDAQQKLYDALLPQADSILNSFVSVDIAATTVAKWLFFDENAFTFNYPDNWKMVEIPPQYTAFQLQKPQKSTDKGFRDNLYLAVNTYKQSNADLGVYAQQALDQLKTTLKNVKITQSVRKKSSNLAYQEVISEGILGTYSVKMKQWHFVKGKKAYSLTFVARLDKFDESNDVVNEVFKSFKLK